MKLPTEAELLVPTDKGTHFIAGALVFLAALVASILLSHPSPDLAAVAFVGVGAAKELLWDLPLNLLEVHDGEPKTHDPSVYDFMATCAGGLVPYLAVLAITGKLLP